MPDGYAGWLLRHLKSKPLCLYSSILVLILFARITSVLGNVCSQFKIHSRLCFGSMSCRGFQFFGFPCLRFSSSLSSRFFSRFSGQSWPPLFSSLQSCSVSVSVSILSLCSSISYSNSGSSLSLRYSVKVVHVFVSSNSGSSLFRLPTV